MITVAVQGREASFHYQAAQNFFADQEIHILGFDTFAETFDALTNKQADYAVAAVENSIHGAINEAYDLLREHQLWICGEQYLHIEQCLIGLPQATPETIIDVYSHFAALSQCRRYLDAQLPQATRHVHPDTAGAVEDVKQWNDPHKAAIASAYAAKYYGLPVLVPNIETNHHNYTRFALLSRTQETPSEATKTTILVELPGHVGALYQTLGIFAKHNLSLSMLTSRPIIGNPGSYQFIIDVTANAQSDDFQAARKEITAAQNSLRVLGSYKSLNTIEQVTSA